MLQTYPPNPWSVYHVNFKLQLILSCGSIGYNIPIVWTRLLLIRSFITSSTSAEPGSYILITRVFWVQFFFLHCTNSDYCSVKILQQNIIIRSRLESKPADLITVPADHEFAFHGICNLENHWWIAEFI